MLVNLYSLAGSYTGSDTEPKQFLFCQQCDSDLFSDHTLVKCQWDFIDLTCMWHKDKYQFG